VTEVSQDLLLGILLGMVLMLVLDHYVYPVVARRWAAAVGERRHHALPVRVDRRHHGGE
jgi:hypothetical protein